jgi:chromosomal replication initiator protein
MNNQQLWQAILGHLEISLSKANFNTWLKNTSVSERGADFLVILVPDQFHKNWISSKYHAEILKALKTFFLLLKKEILFGLAILRC